MVKLGREHSLFSKFQTGKVFIPDDVALVSAHPFKGAYMRNRAKNKPEEEMLEVVKKFRML